MNRRFAHYTLLFCTASLVGCAHFGADLPLPYAKIVEQAEQEGKVIVYSVTSAVPALLEDFQRLYPKVKLEYVSLDTGPLYERVIKESAGGTTADVVWSSAMDLQVKLVAEGYAMTYRSPEAGKLPTWAVWRDQAYGTTFEPIGFVYNKNLIDASEVPQTRAELMQLLLSQPSRFKDKITAFDPAKSGLGYMLMTQDLGASTTFWDTARALGEAGLFAGTGSGAQFLRLNTGESVLGYNLLASYAIARIKKDLPQLAVVLPKDYTMVMSRVAFISKRAAHPNAAKLWLDHLLSKRGQELLAAADLGTLRADVATSMTPDALRNQLGAAMKPIPIGIELLAPLETEKREQFLRVWAAAVAPAAREGKAEQGPHGTRIPDSGGLRR